MKMISTHPRTLAALALATATLTARPAAASFTMLNVGKRATLSNRGNPATNGGYFVVRRDPGLRPLLAPGCPSVSKVEVEAYLQSTYRDAILAKVTLDCSKWTNKRGTWRYSDPGGTVKSIRYGKNGLSIEVGGPGYTPIAGPVGFIQAQLQIGDEILRARFHNFDRNDAAQVRTRQPSLAAAHGEAGFWEVILHDDHSEANQQETIASLRNAAAHDPRDGRSRFLLGMIYLYRFGQVTPDYEQATDAAKADLRESNAWFTESLPLLWDGATLTGDSRVIGFVGAGRFAQSVVEHDAALQAQALADLQVAVQVNQFFNVFDLIPVLQSVKPNDPLFATAYAFVISYLEDPATLACVGSQPELCANAGMAPNNISGSLTLFGDLYAKAGDLAKANMWYGLASALQSSTDPWPFKYALDARVANVPGRIALYQDADPANDPPLIGAGVEACSVCHQRH